jgi:hypothetical protein
MSLIVLLLAAVYSYLHMNKPEDCILMALFLCIPFIIIGIIEELLFFKNYKVIQYIDLAQLVIIIKKIEKNLESLGGEGKGLYEKAESIKHKLSDELLEKILKIAEIRNNAIHGDPKLSNANKIIKEANAINKSVKKIIIFNVSAMRIIKIFLFMVVLIGIVPELYQHIGLGASLLSIVVLFNIRGIIKFLVSFLQNSWITVYDIIVVAAVLIGVVFAILSLFASSSNSNKNNDDDFYYNDNDDDDDFYNNDNDDDDDFYNNDDDDDDFYNNDDR